MKNLLISACAATCFLFMATMMYAESFDTIRTHLPMSARFGQAVLPAGDYTITVLRIGSDIPVLRIESEAAGESVLVAATLEPKPPASGQERTELIIERNGNQHFVSEIHVAGAGFNYRLMSPTPVTPAR